MTSDPGQSDSGQPRLRLTAAGPLVGFGLVGVLVGWAQRPLTLELGGDEPGAGWTPVLLLAFVAICLGWLAWSTRRVLRTPGQLEAHRAVNRMVLGKACALVGAALLGYHVGRFIGLIGITSEASGGRMVQVAVAAVMAVAAVTAALALERACLVRPDGEDDLES